MYHPETEIRIRDLINSVEGIYVPNDIVDIIFAYSIVSGRWSSISSFNTKIMNCGKTIIYFEKGCPAQGIGQSIFQKDGVYTWTLKVDYISPCVDPVFEMGIAELDNWEWPIFRWDFRWSYPDTNDILQITMNLDERTLAYEMNKDSSHAEIKHIDAGKSYRIAILMMDCNKISLKNEKKVIVSFI